MRFHPCICIPSSGQVKARFAVSLASMMGVISQSRLNETVKEQRVDLYMIESSNVAQNRIQLVQKVLDAGGTHVVFIDDDMSFSPNILYDMVNRQVPFVACNYPYRTPHKGFTAGDLDGNPLETNNESTGLVDALWTGLGFAVIQTELFTKIQEPWFVNVWDPEKRKFTSEDVPFCSRLRTAGYRLFVDQDASKQVKHQGMYEYSWDDEIINVPPLNS